MCSRFELSANSDGLRRRFRLSGPPPLPARTELRPTESILVIGGKGAGLMPWGLMVEWQSSPLINARAETLADKPTFRPLLATGRVLVPATAWWEWPRRAKTRIAPADGEVFAFAGLTDGERVVIVTCAPGDGLAAVHDRMPSVLTPTGEEAWLDVSQPFERVASVLRPHAGPFAVTSEAAQGDLFG
jgi:putative SOS response-associated peptidase YedK